MYFIVFMIKKSLKLQIEIDNMPLIDFKELYIRQETQKQHFLLKTQLSVIIITTIIDNNSINRTLTVVVLKCNLHLYTLCLTHRYLSSTHISFISTSAQLSLSLSISHHLSIHYHCWSPDAVCLLCLPQTHTHTRAQNTPQQGMAGSLNNA